MVVVWSHLVGLWLYSTQSSWEPFTIFYNNIMLPFHLYQGLGHFGVVIFFLISGYIISLASEKDTRGEFIVKRVFRIFPVLFVAVGLISIAQLLLARSGLPAIPSGHVNTVREAIGAATLIDQTFLGKNDVLTVTWTLVIEVVFYAFVALIYPLMRRSPVGSTVAILLFGAILIAFAPMLPTWLAVLAPSMIYFPLFAAGRLTYLVQSGRIQPPMFVTLFLLTAMIFVQAYEWQRPGVLFTKAEVIPAWTYAQACILFWLALLAGELRSRILSFFADISYSLYLLHIPVGYTFLLFTKDVLTYSVALPLAVALTTLAATLSWKFIELPGQALARRLSLRFFRMGQTLG